MILLLIITGILLCIILFIGIFEIVDMSVTDSLLEKKRRELKNKNNKF